MQRLADVSVFESGSRQLAGYPLAVVGDLGLLAVLEQIDEDVVHKCSFLINAAACIAFTRGAPFRGADKALPAKRLHGRRAPGGEARKPPARRTSLLARKANRHRPGRGP